MFSDKFRVKNISIKKENKSERGAAMAIAIIVVAILLVIALTALAFSSSEARIAGSDLQRTHAFYAATAGMEKMTNDFSNLFRRKMKPTDDDLDKIAKAPPKELKDEGFEFTQTIEEDDERLKELRMVQGLTNKVYPRVNIPDGPFAGLYASIIPYKMHSTALQTHSNAEVKLEREFNNYLIPLFQFGMFSNEDIEIHPGPLLTFNGRVHSNRNIYALQNTMFLNRVTMAGEFVRDSWRSGKSNTDEGKDNVWVRVNNVDIQSTTGKGSVKAIGDLVGGPYILNSTLGKRGFYPDSPSGVANENWETESIMTAALNVPNRFGGQVLTASTGVKPLKLPIELGGNNSAELIKRSLKSDNEIFSASRYHAKSQIRILIDDEDAGSGATNEAGIPSGGVLLSTFIPTALNGGGDVLKLISDSGGINGSTIQQKNPIDSSTTGATTVRAVSSTVPQVKSGYVPPGSGLKGKILIEIVKPDGTTVNVTQTILSMGVTVGEPNGIVYLQRPLWAAYVQGSHDRANKDFDLVKLVNNSQTAADGEIKQPLTFAANRGYISMDTLTADDDSSIGNITREIFPSNDYNKIVPINVYNVREGWVRSTLDKYAVHERGIMSVVDINMRNLARWVDGVYDKNLLKNTNAVSANINGTEGYVVYISDRRGDKRRTERLSSGTSFASTNGIVDNEDIYGPNAKLDDGEDVIDFGWNADGTTKKGTLQKFTDELPDSGTLGTIPLVTAPVTDRTARANSVLERHVSYFRRSVRLFNGETLSTTVGGADKLSTTKGITVSSENPVYIWGSYNSTGITGIPANGSTLNNGGFKGAQVPASIVCDAIFPISKTWFDASPALYPEAIQGSTLYRKADETITSVTESTTVRAAILAGTTISAMSGSPGRNAANEKINGGIHNYPRFLELWSSGGVDSPWNYTGSLVPLFRSTQAIAQYEDAGSNVYVPPRRNWSFDDTFLTPQRLPPGTPFFQYVQATGFRQKLY